MSTVLYLANRQFQVVTGKAGAKKIAVRDVLTAELPESCMINGIIMDTEVFTAFIRAFWKEHRLPVKDVTLLVSSTRFVGKTVNVPKLNDAGTMEFIGREFAGIARFGDEFYSYIPIPGAGEKTRRVYAESVSGELIREYLEVFREAGIGIRAIFSGESSLISLVNITAASECSTFVVLFADSVTFSALLWANGSFCSLNSVRCFHEKGTEGYAMSAARTVSQIIQFMQANRIGKSLERVYVAGIENGELGLYENAFENQGIEAALSFFDSTRLSDGGREIRACFNAASGLVENGKRHNFLYQYKNGQKKKREKSGAGKGIAAVCCAFLLMAAVTACCVCVKAAEQRKLDRLEEENSNPRILSQIERYDELLDENAFLARQYHAMTEIDENIDSYPVCDDAVIKLIDACSGSYATVEVEAFDSDTGIITMSAKAEHVEEISIFIKELRRQDVFRTVDYTGYSFNKQENMWDIHVVCTLFEAAGRQEEPDET